MSAGQQLLVLAAIVLLSIYILRVYTTENDSTKNIITNAAIIKATGVAQTLLEQIQTEAFDSSTVSKTVNSAGVLTPVACLGNDPGETTVAKFNDLDDYNNYTETDTIGSNDLFNIKVKVSYKNKLEAKESFEKPFPIEFAFAEGMREVRVPSIPENVKKIAESIEKMERK